MHYYKRLIDLFLDPDKSPASCSNGSWRFIILFNKKKVNNWCYIIVEFLISPMNALSCEPQSRFHRDSRTGDWWWIRNERGAKCVLACSTLADKEANNLNEV